MPMPRTQLPLRATTLLVLTAVGLGIYADRGSLLRVGGLSYLAELGTPWVWLAFAAGRVWRRLPAVGVPLGPALITLGLASYWVFVHTISGVGYYQYLGNGTGQYWLLLALILGVGAAAMGAGTGARSKALSSACWGFLPAVPLAECVYLSTYWWSSIPLIPLAGLAVVGVGTLAYVSQVTRPSRGHLTATPLWVSLGWVAASVAHSLR